DFMSYCSPVWVSDYTFGGLRERMKYVEDTKRVETPQATPRAEGGAAAERPRVIVLQSHRVDDGVLVKGPTVEVLEHDEEGVEVVYESASGEALQRVRGFYRPLDNLPT